MNFSQKILTDFIVTPLGRVNVYATEKGICRLSLEDAASEKRYLEAKKKEGAFFQEGENKHLKRLKAELVEYFAGTRKEFEVTLDLQGTEFQKKAWQALQKIPYGQTISYKKQAKNIHNPKAVRAVGTANGKNPILIVVPCHRVISHDGGLGGFGAGLERKQWLLDLEAKNKNN